MRKGDRRKYTSGKGQVTRRQERVWRYLKLRVTPMQQDFVSTPNIKKTESGFVHMERKKNRKLLKVGNSL